MDCPLGVEADGCSALPPGELQRITMIARFLADETGTSAVKYGLIAACISLAIVTVLHSVAFKVRDAVASVD
jgi:pilus assembly protein Flp/PilA